MHEGVNQPKLGYSLNLSNPIWFVQISLLTNGLEKLGFTRVTEEKADQMNEIYQQTNQQLRWVLSRPWRILDRWRRFQEASHLMLSSREGPSQVVTVVRQERRKEVNSKHKRAPTAELSRDSGHSQNMARTCMPDSVLWDNWVRKEWMAVGWSRHITWKQLEKDDFRVISQQLDN